MSLTMNHFNKSNNSGMEADCTQGLPFVNDYTLHDEYIAGTAVWKTAPPFMIIFGTIGNILSILVLTRKNISKSTCSVYLVVLACTDLIVLYTGLLRQWMIAVFGIDIRLYGYAICKIHTWLLYASLDFSSWILVAVTAERVVLVWFPHKAKSRCTKRNALWIIASLALSMMLVNSHLLYGMTDITITERNVTVKKCHYVDNAYADFFNYVWPWIDFFMFSGIPFIFLGISSALIISKVVSSQRAAHRQVVPQNHHVGVRKSTLSSMGIMLVTLNIVFVVFTVPVSVYLIGIEEWYADASAKDKAILSLSWSVVNICMYANNTVNFLLYCLSGNRFRNEIRLMIRKLIGTERHTDSRTQGRLNTEITNRHEQDIENASNTRLDDENERGRSRNQTTTPYLISRPSLI